MIEQKLYMKDLIISILLNNNNNNPVKMLISCNCTSKAGNAHMLHIKLDSKIIKQSRIKKTFTS